MGVTGVVYQGRNDIGGGLLRHVFNVQTDDRGEIHIETSLPRSASAEEVYAAARARYLSESVIGTSASITVGPVNLSVFTPPVDDPLVISRRAWLLTLGRWRMLSTLKSSGFFIGTEPMKNAQGGAGLTVDQQIAAWRTSLLSDLNGLPNGVDQLFYLDGAA